MFNKQILKKIIFKYRNLPRPTLRGVILLFAAIIGLFLGFKFGDVLVIQFSIFILIIMLSSFFIAEYNLRDLVFEREVPFQVFAGQTVNVTINIKNRRSFSNSYCLEFEDQLLGNGCFNHMSSKSAIIPRISAKLLLGEVIVDAEANNSADTIIRNRGVYRYFWYRCNSSFPFGLFRKEIRGMLRNDITVYPNPLVPAVLKDFNSNSMGQEEGVYALFKNNQGVFKGMGEYTFGDHVNLIHWPLSARYQRVVIKEFESSNPNDYAVVFHSYAPKGVYRRQSIERALSLLAGIFIELHRQRSNFNFIADFNQWEPIHVNEDPASLDEALINISLAKLKPNRDLDLLKDAVNLYLNDSNRVIVMSNTHQKHWVSKLPSHPELLCLDNKVKFEKII